MKSLTLAQIIYIQIILQKPLQGETVSPLIIKGNNRGYQKPGNLCNMHIVRNVFHQSRKGLNVFDFISSPAYKTMLFL